MIYNLKNIVIFLYLLSALSCKKESKSNINDSKSHEVINNVVVPNYPLWIFNRLSFEKSKSNFRNETVFKMSRTNSEETAYALLEDIPIEYGHNYKLSVIVKKAEGSNLFGLRIVGEYPNRIDVVFDLKNVLIKGNKNTDKFMPGETSINELEDGWLICTITGKLLSNKINIVLGPTSNPLKTIAWEVQTKDLCDIYIVPSSLTLEEISK